MICDASIFRKLKSYEMLVRNNAGYHNIWLLQNIDSKPHWTISSRYPHIWFFEDSVDMKSHSTTNKRLSKCSE